MVELVGMGHGEPRTVKEVFHPDDKRCRFSKVLYKPLRSLESMSSEFVRREGSSDRPC